MQKKQYNSLTEEQKNKLVKLFNDSTKERSMIYSSDSKVVIDTIRDIDTESDIIENIYILGGPNSLPLLSIGQMIEMLANKTTESQQIINEGGRYSITHNIKGLYATEWRSEYYNELVDALFSAVKSIL